jgi:hypothetical protein
MLSEYVKWYRVSLRLLGDGLPMNEIEAEIEAKLGLVASHVGRKGEPNHRGRKHLSNIWMWRYPAESNVEFEEQIAGLLDVLEPKVTALKAILALPEVEGELFLGFGSSSGQGGAFFTPELLKRIADCGLSVLLDLYPSSSYEEVERVNPD